PCLRRGGSWKLSVKAAPTTKFTTDSALSVSIRENPWLILLLDPFRRLPARRQRFHATAVGLLADQPEVDLALLQAGLEHHDARAVAEAVLAAGALAGERLADRVEVIVVVRQLGHVHQAVDLGLVQLDEQPEAGHAADHAVELAADVLFHPGGAVALVHLALGLVGAARALGALQRQRGHVAVRVAV